MHVGARCASVADSWCQSSCCSRKAVCFIFIMFLYFILFHSLIHSRYDIAVQFWMPVLSEAYDGGGFPVLLVVCPRKKACFILRMYAWFALFIRDVRLPYNHLHLYLGEAWNGGCFLVLLVVVQHRMVWSCLEFSFISLSFIRGVRMPYNGMPKHG